MTGIDKVGSITVAVRDQDEALTWFTEKLGFRKTMDRPGPGMRFLAVCARHQPDLQIILAPWFPDLVGKNATAILHTSDCQGTYEELKARGVEFTESPQPRPFGLQAIFKDLYGNSYALLEVKGSPR